MTLALALLIPRARIEGVLVDEFFAGGEDRTALRGHILQTQHLALQSQSLDVEGHANEN